MHRRTIGLLLAVMFSGTSAWAYDANDPNNCNGIDWDDKHALVVARLTAKPRVNFVKSPYDDDFKADGCPSAAEACRKKSYLVMGDLVLVGKTQRDFTCVSYQSPQASEQRWTTGWLPSTALAPLAPMESPKLTDWLGSWVHPGGHVDISRGDGGKLRIDGEQVVPTAQDFHNGALAAQTRPKGHMVAFAEDGSIPFEQTGDGQCRVRMQRVGRWLLVEDNDGCGGAGVTFTGLYRRN